MRLAVWALPDHIFENIDNLTYSYNGNQVESINDTGTDANYTGAQDFKDRSETSDEYDYDNNGNMSKDLNKNINKISYNYINLPDTLQMRNGNMLTYGYDAAGNKTFVVRRTATGSSVSMPMSENLLNNTVGYTVASTSTSMYLDNIVYEDGYLMKVLDTDGILLRTNTRTETTPVFKRNYYIKDHLGNIRVVFDENGIINQVNHYYPFGMEYGQEAENQTELKYQDYLFGGKEFDRKYELNTYDFGARFHDATRGQWTTPDPLAEDYYDVSPYVYGLNNPLRYNDPTGMTPSDTINGGSLKEVNVVADFFKNGLALALYSTSILGSQVNRVFGIGNASFSDNVAAGFIFHTFALMPLSLLKPKHFGTNTEPISETNKRVEKIKT